MEVHSISAGIRPIETELAGWRKHLWLTTAILAKRPYSVQKFVSRAYRKLMQTELAKKPPDVVIVDHAQMSWLLEEIPSSTPVVLCAHNVEHHIYGNAGEQCSGLERFVVQREARLMLQLERWAARRADHIWTLSDDDAGWFTEHTESGRVSMLPVAATVRDEPPGMSDTASVWRFDIGLIGTWTWGPNRVGLDWFLNEVVPQVSPDLNIGIAGKGAEFIREGSRQVEYLGFVPNAEKFLRHCRIVAVPSIVGTGVQIKTIEAAGQGHMLVATTVAARGISPVPPNVLIADSPTAFAHAITHALEMDTPDRRRGGRKWGRLRRRRFEATLRDSLEGLDTRYCPAVRAATSNS